MAIEQFDASARRPFGLATGGTSRSTTRPPASRWLSGRGELRLHAPRGPALCCGSRASPIEYFRGGPDSSVCAGDRIVREEMLQSDFLFDTPIPSELLSTPVALRRSKRIRPCPWSAAAGRRIGANSAYGSSSASRGWWTPRLPSQADERAAERGIEVSNPGAFQQQQARQQRVDGSSDRDFVGGVLFRGQPAPPLGHPSRTSGRKSVCSSCKDALDYEAGARDQLPAVRRLQLPTFAEDGMIAPQYGIAATLIAGRILPVGPCETSRRPRRAHRVRRGNTRRRTRSPDRRRCSGTGRRD